MLAMIASTTVVCARINWGFSGEDHYKILVVGINTKNVVTSAWRARNWMACLTAKTTVKAHHVIPGFFCRHLTGSQQFCQPGFRCLAGFLFG